MRKLNTKNKAYIIALSLLVFIVLLAIIFFIVYKVKDLNIKYNIPEGSVTYTSKKELVKVTENTYAKKSFIGNYYMLVDDKKVTLGNASVIYDTKNENLLMLGTYFEIKDNGEVDKLKGQTQITGISTSRIFKIGDRRYLIVSPAIVSSDGSLNAKSYLLIDIDKKGNAYLYNHENNIKSFNELELITPDFTFKVNEEMLIRDEEQIDLSKINGSTNEYKPTEKEPGEGEGDGTGDGDGSGDGEGSGTGSGSGESLFPPGNTNPVIITDTVTEEKYVQRKTTIIGLEPTASSVKINYIVFDPMDEFKNLYVVVRTLGEEDKTYNMDLSLTSHLIEGLKASKKYQFDFYYTYEDSDNNEQNVLFDSLVCTTKSINSHITLEKTTQNSVRYTLKIDDGYKLDSAKVKLYIDGTFAGESEINPIEAASKVGYTGEINFTEIGQFAVLELTDCIYNGAPIDIGASYKYKL